MFPVMKFILNLSIIIVRWASQQYNFVCFPSITGVGGVGGVESGRVLDDKAKD